MNPEQRLLIVFKYLTVEVNILFLGAFIRMLGPERMCIIQGNRSLLDLELGYFLSRAFFLTRLIFFYCLYNNIVILLVFRIDCLKFLRRISLLQINRIWHERAVLLDDFSCLVFVTKLQTVFVQEQSNLSTYYCSVSFLHIELCTAITFPVYRCCTFFIGKCINVYCVCYHKCRIEA